APMKALAALFRPFPHRNLLSAQNAISIRREVGNNLGVAYAVATPDSCALVPAADRYMAEQLAALFPQSISAADRINTEGLAPEATRIVSLRGTGVAGLFRDKDDATFAWSVTPTKSGNADGPAPGWWVAGINPDSIERTTRSLTTTNKPGEWSALAETRPASLATLLGSAAVLPISPSI
ncbi:MAG: hypothetical protein KDA30_16030, partial [Phycisphaerales bacterium]|nr:hypothetical protein [Phycisphaerales bacterium]